MATFKELLLKEHPGKIDRVKRGEMWGCPCQYGYETEEESLSNCTANGGDGCEHCWNREISNSEVRRNGNYPKNSDSPNRGLSARFRER